MWCHITQLLTSMIDCYTTQFLNYCCFWPNHWCSFLGAHSHRTHKTRWRKRHPGIRIIGRSFSLSHERDRDIELLSYGYRIVLKLPSLTLASNRLLVHLTSNGGSGGATWCPPASVGVTPSVRKHSDLVQFETTLDCSRKWMRSHLTQTDHTKHLHRLAP